ncbi:hypothetical protein KEM54_003715 [Ascosphaera aggregata]|nr:hypothetical protein KEM54_003715 [Ascosphaera aggregata]
MDTTLVQPTLVAPLGMTSPVNEFLKIILQMSRHKGRRDVQRIPQHLVKALLGLDAINDVCILQQIVACLRSDGDRICSQFDGQEVHALLHVLLVAQKFDARQYGLHLLLEYIRKLTTESQRTTRNVATTAAAKKRRSFATAAMPELLGLFLGETSVEQKIWVWDLNTTNKPKHGLTVTEWDISP